jgi:hypothetical protein
VPSCTRPILPARAWWIYGRRRGSMHAEESARAADRANKGAIESKPTSTPTQEKIFKITAVLGTALTLGTGCCTVQSTAFTLRDTAVGHSFVFCGRSLKPHSKVLSLLLLLLVLLPIPHLHNTIRLPSPTSIHHQRQPRQSFPRQASYFIILHIPI